MAARPFLVIGAMKSGTTTVESLLASHSEVTIALDKETTAFNGMDGAHAAARQILRAQTAVAGEVSTGYMQHPWVTSDPSQARRLLGSEMVVIAVLRDPLTRASSHWRHWEQLGRNRASLPASLTDPNSAHVAFSRYYEQLSRWAEVLTDDRILVLRLEDYATDPERWQRSITDFLGIAPLPSTEMVISNSADSRIVARSAGRLVSRSGLYRRVVRPLVPDPIRRLGARSLGGRRGGGLSRESLQPDHEEMFRSLIARDGEQLRSRWPHAAWDNEKG
ncbi:sulfotransferase domain-containing protein [Janibacter corallicola]|uniref:sulfotransferase domain-containing protein n=1 Tax=Janibacter corallicola TaxID=415212 RepID=UPI0008372D19|nr:sulfotransferase domain-containing protein [Janibacter corallicola]